MKKFFIEASKVAAKANPVVTTIATVLTAVDVATTAFDLLFGDSSEK